MKFRLFISTAFLVVLFAANIFAQSNPVQINDGRFLINGYSNGENPQNALIKTDVFSAVSSLGGRYSPWYDICITTPTECSFGQTINVPLYPRVDLGGCIGSCYQFVRGTFTINGTTYENAYFRGYFDFSQAQIFIPKSVRRKGTMTFRKPFTLSGFLEVCSETNIDRNCPADRILFSGNVAGRGTLTVTMSVRISELARPFPYPYLFQQSFEYQFEP